jgi:hypothetical protein
MKHGELVTDTIASWVKQGFVCGPFVEPPLNRFRVNPLMAVEQDDKVRLVMNVSLPKDQSMNDNIDESKLEKVHMSSARSVSYLIKEAGKNAWISKMDKKDAYKIVPAPTEELRLQGFKWMNRYFAETQQIFGAETSVSNFDCLGKTVQSIIIAECGVPEKSSPRQLDDTIKVDHHKSNKCQEFTEKYVSCCKELNIKLAANCERKEKAFENSHYGKILGILFDTETLTWSLPEDKRYKAMVLIDEELKNEKITLLRMQKLMGRLNDICLMCPFLNGFKRSLNDDLGKLQREQGELRLSTQSRKDLLIWAGFLMDEDRWCPIASRPAGPPVFRKEFSSDSAGGQSYKGKIGCGCVGFSEIGEICFANQLFWPEEGLLQKTDGKGAKFGNKTTTLELVGVILPYLLIPEKLIGQHIVMKVDNTACIFGWENKSVAGDKCASILIRGLHLISAYLGSVLHFMHLPRMSSWDAELVDRLSRERTTTDNDRRLVRSLVNRKLPQFFTDWLVNPTESYELAEKMLDHVTNLCKLV